MTVDQAAARLRGLCRRLSERAEHNVEFGIVGNPREGQHDQISICTVSRPGVVSKGEASKREFFALVKQAKPLLEQLGAPLADYGGSVVSWAWENVVNDRERTPGARAGKVATITTPVDHPYRLLSMAIEFFLAEADSAPAGNREVQLDPATEARDKWLYQEATKGTAWNAIIRRLKKKPKAWGEINSVSGVKAAADRYARRHKLSPVPSRRRGRPARRTLH